MIEYPKITPIIPGNEIDGWQAIRKKQWKYVKRTLEEVFDFERYEIKHVKDTYYLSDTFPEDDQPADWEPIPLLSIWLSAIQTHESHRKIWDSLASGESEGEYDYEQCRKYFIKYAHEGEEIPTKDQHYGAYGGMEQTLLPFFVLSDEYTDETFLLGDQEYRKIPWINPTRTVYAILSGHIDMLATDNGKNISMASPFTYFQWLHGLLISSISKDLNKQDYYNQSDFVYYFENLTSVLDEDYVSQIFEPHLQSCLKLVEILEDSTSPKYLRDLWKEVKKERGF